MTSFILPRISCRVLFVKPESFQILQYSLRLDPNFYVQPVRLNHITTRPVTPEHVRPGSNLFSPEALHNYEFSRLCSGTAPLDNVSHTETARFELTFTASRAGVLPLDDVSLMGNPLSRTAHYTLIRILDLQC